MRTDSKKPKNGNSRDLKSKVFLFQKPPFLRLFYIAVLINMVTIGGIFLLNQKLPPELPLFYGLPEGKDQLTSRFGLLLAPGASMAIVLINAFFASFIKNEFQRKTLMVAGLLVSFLSLITTTQIVFLVGIL